MVQNSNYQLKSLEKMKFDSRMFRIWGKMIKAILGTMYVNYTKFVSYFATINVFRSLRWQPVIKEQESRTEKKKY